MNPRIDLPKVILYMAATCPYCVRAETLLLGKGCRTIQRIRVDLEPHRREEMIARSGRYTVPQIFIDDAHIGGCDDLYALDDSGQLDGLLGFGAVA